MDILFFTELSPFLPQRVGGAETSMRRIAEGLAARGHRVTFASLRPDPVPWPTRIAPGGPGGANGIELVLLPSPRQSIPVRAARRLGREGLARRLAERRWDRAAALLFANRRPDVLYAFYETEFLTRAIAARARTGMAVVMRMAGLAWYERLKREPAARAEIAAAFAGVEAINFLSEASRALVLARAGEAGLALEDRPGFVADIGVDVGGVPHLWEGPSPGPGLSLVVATRFSAYQKRQDILVEALARLKGRLPLRATLIGDGPTRGAIARRVEALGLGESVEIVPHMDQAALWRRLREADLLCHPCDHEGVSKIILEAMMLGLPVLASDVEPLPEYVIEGKTGFRVANDPDAWAARLAALAADKAALAAVSAPARAFVEARYDMGRNIDLYEAHFRELLSGRRAEAPAMRGAAGGPQ